MAKNKVREIEQLRQNCVNEVCRKTVVDFETQLAKKSKDIYDLTVKLGCIQSENIELKVELKEKFSIYESHLGTVRH